MGTLTFVERRWLFSVYRTSRGETVYLAHDEEAPFTRFTVDLSEIDLAELWVSLQMSREDFLAFLEVTGPDIVDEVEWCVRCSGVRLREDGFTVEDDEFACSNCVDAYYRTCTRCSVLVQEVTWTLSDHSICGSCIDHYSYCDDCDGYYSDAYSDDHLHGDCDRRCESPAQRFTVRNDGEAPLDNDTRATITLPAGVIDAEGLERIRQYLCSQGLYEESYELDALGDAWQTREGNFTKRFSRRIYKRYGRKVQPEVLSMIGTIAGEHSRSVDVIIKVTRDLNQSAEYFYHDDSCWWGSYTSSRCALKTNGGFGLLTFEGDVTWHNATGRAWVMPLRLRQGIGDLAPTFDTMTPDAFVVFNGYGALDGYSPARIVAHMAGMTYRKIGFECSPMFINGDMGYLVAPEDIATNYTDGYLRLSVNSHSSLFEDEQITISLTETEKELADAVA